MRAVRRHVHIAFGFGCALVFGWACSDDDSDANPTAPASTSSGTAAPGSAGTPPPTATSAPPTSAIVTETSAGIAPTTAAPVVTATPVTVAEAGGWRLAVTQPMVGATIRSTTVLCTEISGTSREPEVALEITLLAPGSPTGDLPRLVDAAVGRDRSRSN